MRSEPAQLLRQLRVAGIQLNLSGHHYCAQHSPPGPQDAQNLHRSVDRREGATREQKHDTMNRMLCRCSAATGSCCPRRRSRLTLEPVMEPTWGMPLESRRMTPIWEGVIPFLASLLICMEVHMREQAA